ncbi:homoserine kinase [Jonesia denitrificans]|uniref:Homoserine kinase n=1 Tax=Jonesia denitrificans (strain ATCC 14870 / DSM 20603 / BCRC 15368 / CIP 55.134 / JCM 11481 / NBRC 15587 / NCTC 10816 / Prevot 55134) TaxID=471856 RepID=C7QZD3_JONDD|nr:homoserine kinase [Jonesia denitrificans]ACV09431.1 homoserine kinase [Jonesia denitrificans DSM 20603]ASE09326.1 homoserine kinase [Jonesia denitrificans]QXB43870.1 homoserine kinase [Jonesia denitrificans]SQH21768.1 Homoserine kinase [Jonesia denitrificans]
MRIVADAVQVTVPATSANLGPGFDALGLALQWQDELTIHALGSDNVSVDVEGEGQGEVPRDASHLVVATLRRALDHVGASHTGLRLVARNTIPHGRGLGSSAAAVVAGLMAARGFISEPDALNDSVLLNLATQIEGHPDNAAPAILGGATVAWMTDHDRPCAAQLDLHPDVQPTVVVPTTRLSTHRARGVLPPAVAHSSATFNAGRSALLVHALAHNTELLFDATDDRLHQEFRSSVMPQSWALITQLREQGLAATVSGAGPTVLILHHHDDTEHVQATVKRIIHDTDDLQEREWVVKSPQVNRTGATVERVTSLSK